MEGPFCIWRGHFCIFWQKMEETASSAPRILRPCYILTRTVSLELLPDTTMANLISCRRRFTARRTRPKKIHSDNAQAFKAAAKWWESVAKDESVLDKPLGYMVWPFNLGKTVGWTVHYGGVNNLSESLPSQSKLRTRRQEMKCWDSKSYQNRWWILRHSIWISGWIDFASK